MLKMKTLVIAFLCLLSFSVISQVKTNFTQQDYSKFILPEAVPADLKKDGHILTVMSPFTEKQKNNETLKALFQAHYNGKFVWVPMNSFEFSDKMNDTAVYKYMLMIMEGSDISAGNGGYTLSIFNKVYMGLKGKKKEQDPRAFIKTGLSDVGRKLDEMLAFYADRLSEAKE